MLDFYGLFASYVAFFPGGLYMEIESLRLDFKPNIYLNSTSQENRARRSKKKKKNTEEADLGSRDPRDFFLSLSDLTISLSLI